MATYSIPKLEYKVGPVNRVVQQEIKMELSRIDGIAAYYAKPLSKLCFRGVLIKAVETGYRGDFSSVVDRLRATQPEMFRENVQL